MARRKRSWHKLATVCPETASSSGNHASTYGFFPQSIRAEEMVPWLKQDLYYPCAKTVIVVCLCDPELKRNTDTGGLSEHEDSLSYDI